MTKPTIRRAALAAGLFAGLVAVAPAADVLTAPVSQQVMKADADFLAKGLSKEPEKREISTLKAAAMLLALNAQQTKAGYRDQALKVAEEISAKKYTEAKTAADGLATAKAEPGEDKKLAELNKFDLAEVMSCFRADRVGGMNLEKDIKAYGKALSDIDAAKVVAGRVALIAVYTKALPPAEAGGAAKKKKWDDLSDQMRAISHEILADLNGAAPNKTAVEKNFVRLNSNCNACHTDFRN